MPPCLKLNIIRYISRVKWSNPGKRVAPSLTPLWSSYWKGAFESFLTTVANFTFLYTIWQFIFLIMLIENLLEIYLPILD